MAFSHQDAVDSNDYQINVDGSYPTFVAYADSIAIAQNKSMLSVVNAGGSSVLMRLRELYIINVQTTAVTGVVAQFRLYRISGHSAGTSLTPLASDTNDSLDSSITARTGSTVSGEAASFLRRHYWSSDEWGVGAADVESNQHDRQSALNIVYAYKQVKPLTFRAGEGFTVKQITNSSVGTFDVIAVFTQENP